MGEFLAAIKSTLVEIADSKKAMFTLTGLIGSALVAIGGRMGWSWLTPEAADAIALKASALAAAYVLAQAHVDNGKEQAKGPQADPLSPGGAAAPPQVAGKD